MELNAKLNREKEENKKKEYKDEILCTVGGIILFVEMGVLFVFCLILC